MKKEWYVISLDTSANVFIDAEREAIFISMQWFIILAYLLKSYNLYVSLILFCLFYGDTVLIVQPGIWGIIEQSDVISVRHKRQIENGDEKREKN